ncbi:hypothetical protein PHLCEN_2v5600 [Hermanssonia centrifuga]|uniref:Alternative oxidase n=1 Tax=Hermanssonia centrifuga TaxID=98765 RepID=A0A2R6P1Z4_9APHY|nr:hypothetical protein PHLCEN_2v5600 [Hermanssonia centrifuga]
MPQLFRALKAFTGVSLGYYHIYYLLTILQEDTSPPSDALLTKADVVSVIPAIVKGDWVLFHPVYSPEELRAVEVRHREAKTLGDKAASTAVLLARKCFDIISGYKHKPIPPNSKMTIEELRKGGYILDEKQWLARILFLESIAGVPGMVAATLRHLRSLRLMKRDAGWIHTLLEEAENERMHLMTFMTIRKPSIFFRILVLGAQGVFYNAFYFEAGHLPAWKDMPAPEIAKDYWRLNDDAKLLDVIYAVRSDESTHRFVNHSLANLNYKTDINPFALREPDMHVKGTKLGFDRDEAEEYVRASHKLIDKGRETGQH